MEDAVIQYCLEMIGFENGEGIFAPGGSIGNMYSLICARYAIKIFLQTLYINHAFYILFICFE